jgi:hypothetical protein
MTCDRDWDVLGDRIAELLPELEDRDLGRLLLAVGDALSGSLDPVQRPEIEGLGAYVLGASSRSWRKHGRPVPVFLLEAWYAASALFVEPAEPPPVRATWNELRPSQSIPVGGLTARELQELDDWLTLAQILAAHDPGGLERLGFYEPEQQSLLAHLAVELGEFADPELTGLVEGLLRRIRELSPRYGRLARDTLTRLKAQPSDEHWWVPQDIDAPPSREPVSHARTGFTREDVSRVLADL